MRHTAAHCNTLPYIATHCNTPAKNTLHVIDVEFLGKIYWSTPQHAATQCNTLQQTRWNTFHMILFEFICKIYCSLLQHTATHGNTRQHMAKHWNTLYHERYHERCNTLQHTATHGNTLQHTATHYITNTIRVIDAEVHVAVCCSKCDIIWNTLYHKRWAHDTSHWCWILWQHVLQHTATHCNTLQHTATSCNTLQHNVKHSLRTRYISLMLNSLANSVTTEVSRILHYWMYTHTHTHTHTHAHTYTYTYIYMKIIYIYENYIYTWT